MRPYFLCLFLGAALFLSGCGIKGSLYLPDVPSADPAPQQPAPDDTKAPAYPT